MARRIARPAGAEGRGGTGREATVEGRPGATVRRVSAATPPDHIRAPWITMNIYSHVMPTQLAAAADAIGTALWGTDSDQDDDDDQGDAGSAGVPAKVR